MKAFLTRRLLILHAGRGGPAGSLSFDKRTSDDALPKLAAAILGAAGSRAGHSGGHLRERAAPRRRPAKKRAVTALTMDNDVFRKAKGHRAAAQAMIYGGVTPSPAPPRRGEATA